MMLKYRYSIALENNILMRYISPFSSVSLLLEQSPGGGVVTQARVSSAALFRYTTSFDNFVLACEVSYQ